MASKKKLGAGDPTLFKRDIRGVFQDKRILGHTEHSVLQEWDKPGIRMGQTWYKPGAIYLNVHIAKQMLWHVEGVTTVLCRESAQF